MFNITLISTRHEDIGECNSNELFKIIQKINPEIIFEEIPPTFFNKYYVEQSCSNLETDAINKYIQKNDVEHIPVDSDEVPPENFFKDYEYLINRIEGLADCNGFTFRNQIDNNKRYIEKYGFKYLNSKDSIKINGEISNVIRDGLQSIDDDKLFQIFKSWENINKMRENHMLKNIYTFSSKHSYKKAIYTVGVAHRSSTIKKISKLQKTEKIKLNWNYYNDRQF